MTATLEEWTSPKWTDGIQVDQLNDLESIIAETANSIYEITVLRASTGDVLVRGGKLFPERTRAQIIGASWGGPTVKLSGIYTGMNVEFRLDNHRVVTSPVQSIKIIPSR
jgi:hypothetical protein